MLPDVTGTTRIAAVIGSPVKHSLSPAIHNAGFAAIGFDAIYGAFEVAPERAGAAVDAMRDLGLLGLNATMPHKESVLAGCDLVTSSAEALGAANHLSWADGQIVGDNTDGEGWRRGLAGELGVDPAGRRVGVVGAGGAARAVLQTLATAGAADIVVVNRSRDGAQRALALAGDRGRLGDHGDLVDLDLIVNATPLGMGGTSGADVLAFAVDDLADHVVISDLIYHPAQTPLLAAASRRGLVHQNGLSMLIHQAAVAFESWTGVEAPVAVMRAAVDASLMTR